MISKDTLQFIREHRNDDVRSLALRAQNHIGVDMPTALTQIAGWQTATEKIPSWQTIDEIFYPQHLSLEQCSSEMTARYKASILPTEEDRLGSFTDLTGGFGIDCAFLAPHFRQATYVEQQQSLCEIAAHNFPLLGLESVVIHHKDGVSHLQEMEPVDWIFIDPARRDGHGGKMIAIADCEPNVTQLETLLLEKANHVMVKLSPMLDLSLALQELKHVQEIYIISVNNECKELLFLLGKEVCSPNNLPIHCVNLQAKGEKVNNENFQHFTFTRRQETSSPCEYTSELGEYLYEPNSSILKSGAFRSIAYFYKLKKLHPNSHLYTSETLIPDYPGRKFHLSASCSFNKKELKQMVGTEAKANLTIRNFPSSVSELRKRLKLTEGGDTYLFATTLADGQKVLISCEKAQ